jgi:hypothetical protein
MKVYVIMGNDYPGAVFDNEAAADRFIALKKAENDKNMSQGMGGKIYWRKYEFKLNEGEK